jgi:hypothetical protein
MIKITYPGLELVESILSTSETVRENKRRRERFLNTLYQRHRSNNKNMQIEELSRELGFDDALTRNILRYFIHKCYVEQQGLGGRIKIIYEGIKEVERNLTNF